MEIKNFNMVNYNSRPLSPFRTVENWRKIKRDTDFCNNFVRTPSMIDDEDNIDNNKSILELSREQLKKLLKWKE